MSEREIGIEAARAKLGDLVNDARAGHTTYLTRRGRRVAAITPVTEPAMTAHQHPAHPATANVVTGVIRVQPADADDTDIYPAGGGVLTLLAEVEPWGAEEEDMSRADDALRRMGWRRVSPWVGEETLACQVEESATISFTETYNPVHDDLSLLALPLPVEQRLTDALDRDTDGYDVDQAAAIEQEIAVEITGKLRTHGVDTGTGEWLGEWSAEAIVTGVLDRHGVTPAGPA